MFTDSHTHTRNSFDAEKDSVIDRCEAAIKLGMTAMAITDHSEVNRFYPSVHYGVAEPSEDDVYNYEYAFENSVAETLAARDIYSKRLTLICGVELGQGTADDGITHRIYNDSRIDFVIGSMHELKGKQDFFFLDYSKEDIHKLMQDNFKEILELCRQNNYDVLGHITYALRYIEGEQGFVVDLSLYKNLIAEIFRENIRNRKGIEINTSGLRQKYGRTFPTLELLKLYKDMGGRIVTFGSDSHSTHDLGAGIEEGMALAVKAGFTQGAYYVKHEPHFFDL